MWSAHHLDQKVPFRLPVLSQAIQPNAIPARDPQLSACSSCPQRDGVGTTKALFLTSWVNVSFKQGWPAFSHHLREYLPSWFAAPRRRVLGGRVTQPGCWLGKDLGHQLSGRGVGGGVALQPWLRALQLESRSWLNATQILGSGASTKPRQGPELLPSVPGIRNVSLGGQTFRQEGHLPARPPGIWFRGKKGCAHVKVRENAVAGEEHSWDAGAGLGNPRRLVPAASAGDSNCSLTPLRAASVEVQRRGDS